MAAAMDFWNSVPSSLDLQSDPFKGSELMEALEPFMKSGASSSSSSSHPSPNDQFYSLSSTLVPFCSTSTSYSSSLPCYDSSFFPSTEVQPQLFPQSCYSAHPLYGFDQQGPIGLNHLTPSQIHDIQAQISLQSQNQQHMTSSGAFHGQWPSAHDTQFQQAQHHLLAPKPVPTARFISISRHPKKPTSPLKLYHHANGNSLRGIRTSTLLEGVERPNTMGENGKQRILMVSDFFYPNFGGVENHIYYLSQCLIKLGHKVVVMTHAYNDRTGVRYMTGGLKVYYVPWKPFLMQNTLPTFYWTLPIMRTILIREKISVVHGHQAFSTLCHEAVMHARTMGYKVVFTDHSLYGFADLGSIHMNKVLQFTLADVSQAICVSHTSKENTVLRSGLPPGKVFVIPNAVDTTMFKPAPERLSNDEIVIVVVSRLVYRKGADLLVEVIPEVCRLHPNVRFVIGGDGPKRVRLEEMREKNSLQDRVDMLGAVPHAKVRSVLISGHIFLNSSLTEAFCIAILEAASCGLLTVSTRVGGVPEVLPDDMIVLAEPDPSDMVRAITKAINMLPQIDSQTMHLRMKKLYSWHDVARRTEIVYDHALRCRNQPLLERLSRYLTCGAWAGKLFCLVMLVDYVLWLLLQLWKPEEDIEVVPDVKPASFLHGEKSWDSDRKMKPDKIGSQSVGIQNVT